MATAVSICSNALQRLGAESFNDFSEGDATGLNLERVKLCNNFWPVVRQRVLRSSSWGEATARVILSPHVNAPAFGYSQKFSLPGDWLRIISVEGSSGALLTDYQREGSYILCDETAIYLKYIYDLTDPAFYSSTLVDVMELAMASQLAYPVVRSTALAESAKGEYERALRMARAHDAGDDPNPTFGDSPLIASRFGRNF